MQAPLEQRFVAPTANRGRDGRRQAMQPSRPVGLFERVEDLREQRAAIESICATRMDGRADPSSSIRDRRDSARPGIFAIAAFVITMAALMSPTYARLGEMRRCATVSGFRRCAPTSAGARPRLRPNGARCSAARPLRAVSCSFASIVTARTASAPFDCCTTGCAAAAAAPSPAFGLHRSLEPPVFRRH